jgi:nucleotide-binding universal stress UspA family protein
MAELAANEPKGLPGSGRKGAKMKILVAIDESKFSQAVVQMIIAQHRSESTQLRLIHVVEPFTFYFPPEITAEYAAAPQIEALHKDRVEKGKALLAAAADHLRKAGFTAETVLSEGDVRSAIIDSAAESKADLIVVGSHGRKGLDRFLMGSVSEFVVRHAPCSVEIVRLPVAR